jgi:hypothetical protein
MGKPEVSDSWALHMHGLTAQVRPAAPIRPARRPSGSMLCGKFALGRGPLIKGACWCGQGAPFGCGSGSALGPATGQCASQRAGDLCFAGCMDRPARAHASPLACSRAGQRLLQVRIAGEWCGGEARCSLTACGPAGSFAHAPVTCPPSHKIIVLLLLHIINTTLLHHYFGIT